MDASHHAMAFSPVRTSAHVRILSASRRKRKPGECNAFPSSFQEGSHLDLAEEEFRALGLEEDFPLSQARLGPHVDDQPVDDVRDRVAVTDYLHPVPLAG